MKGKKHHKASGGKVEDAGGSKFVEHEAEEPEGERENKKRGGRVHKAKKHGGKIEGKAARHHLGRPGRKRGGRVGADLAPLSSASKSSGIGKQAPVQSGPHSSD
jgi:hypothetical protein